MIKRGSAKTAANRSRRYHYRKQLQIELELRATTNWTPNRIDNALLGVK